MSMSVLKIVKMFENAILKNTESIVNPAEENGVDYRFLWFKVNLTFLNLRFIF